MAGNAAYARRHGGDIVKFAGDAVTIVWLTHTPASLPGDGWVDTLKTAAALACACALDLHNMCPYEGLRGRDGKESCLLDLHMGIGVGDMVGIHVGGVNDRWEYVLAGSPKRQIAIAEPLALSGQTAVSPETLEILGDVLQYASHPSNPGYTHHICRAKALHRRRACVLRSLSVSRHPRM